jgi:hypothetical protein
MPVTHLGNVDLPNEHHDARFFASQAYAASPANRGGYLFQPALSTPEHAVWYNAYKKDVHVAFRGTVPTNSKDLVSDAMLMARAEGSNARFADAVSTLESLARKYSDTSLSVSGHSLGGQLATHVLHHASDATAVRIAGVTTFNKASTPLPTGFHFKEARTSKQTNIKQAGDVVSEAAEPNDSHTIVLNNFTGGGLAAHKLESFARSDKTNVTVGRQSVEKNLTKEGLMVGALGAESNPYSAAANVVADVAVAEGVPGASYVQSGLAAASVVGLATTIGEGMFAAATLPEVAAAAAVPLAVAGGIGAAQYGVKELDDALFGSSANAPAAPAFNTVSRAYLPPKPSSQDTCQSGERRLAGGACAATSSTYEVDWTSQPDASTEDTPTEDTPTDNAPASGTSNRAFGAAAEGLSVSSSQLGTQRTESVADEPPLGYFIYDASQDFHGQVVVF